MGMPEVLDLTMAISHGASHPPVPTGRPSRPSRFDTALDDPVCLGSRVMPLLEAACFD
jgi:hypothetical protein